MQKSKNLLILIISLLCAMFLAFGVSVNISLHANSAQALQSTAGAVKAGNGEDLWNAADGGFNDEVLSDLLDKLFGNEDPVEYVKSMKDAQTGNFVVPASAINQKVGSVNDGLAVKLDGKEWMAASLTVAEIEEEENVVLTLYLANDLGTSQYYTNNSNVKGNDMYSSSTLRKHLLENANWSLFQDTGEKSFARQFLVQPKNIKYQQTESMVGRANVPLNYNCPNDALGELSSGWNGSVYYQPDDSYKGAFSMAQRYDAWGEDYIWIPSATETGFQNHLQTSSIWQLSANQLAHNGNSRSWLRSGSFTDYINALLLLSSGAYGYDNVNVPNGNGVRPAFHLNLTKVTAHRVSVPTTYEASRGYTGSDIEFLLKGYDSNIMEVTIPNEFKDIIRYNETKHAYTVKDAGNYYLNVKITNEDYVWKGTTEDRGEKKINFSVTPAPLAVELTSATGSWHVTKGSKFKVSVYAPIANGTGDKVALNILASLGTDKWTLFESLIIEDGKGGIFSCELDTDILPIAGDYKLSVVAANTYQSKNYALDLQGNYTLTVNDNTGTAAVIWTLEHGSGTALDYLYAWEGDTSLNYVSDIAYDGKEYSFTARVPANSGYKLDTNYNSEGFVNGYKNAAATNAGEYVTQVRLISSEASGSVAKIYEVKWKINQAKYDLTNVEWNAKGGKLEYTGAQQTVALKAESLPAGLTPQYGGSVKGREVGEAGKAQITGFTVADTKNYILPVKGDPSTYIYEKDGEFPWEIEWEIVKAKIDVKWSTVTVTDPATGIKYSKPVLADSGYESFVKYVYYETNSKGILISDEPVEEIVPDPNNEKYYVCEVMLSGTAGSNFELVGETTSNFFSVGNNITEVRISARGESDGVITVKYNGSAQEIQIIVLEGSLPASAFDIKYYSGMAILNSAPSEIGEYRAEVTLKAEYASDYVLDGTHVWTIKIEKGELSAEWDTQTLPPKLNLNTEQAKLINYVYFDSEGNRLNFEQLVQAGAGEFEIRAEIKPEYREKYAFTGTGEYYSEKQTFTVTEGATLVDPDINDDPNNPDNPDNPDNPNNPDNPDDPNNPDNPDGDNNGTGCTAKVSPWLWVCIVLILLDFLLCIFTFKVIKKLREADELEAEEDEEDEEDNADSEQTDIETE